MNLDQNTLKNGFKSIAKSKLAVIAEVGMEKNNFRTPFFKKKKNGSDFSLPFNGGGHGTRTHGAVTPYLISNQAP